MGQTFAHKQRLVLRRATAGRRGHILVLVLMLLLSTSYTGVWRQFTDHRPSTRGNTNLQLCVQRNGGWTAEGVGSFHQHIKSSIILAQALGAELRLPGLPFNEHNYSVPWLTNSTCPNSRSAPLNSCTVNATALEQLIPSMCHGLLRGPEVLEALGVSNCTTFYHHVNWELHEDLNDCVGHWYRSVLFSNSQPINRKSKHASVGVHLRWGDAAGSGIISLGSNTTHAFRGSPSIQQVNVAFTNIVFNGCQKVDVYFYMEKHPEIEQGTFKFSNFTVVDSGDAISDLRHYASNDIIIGGSSSWAVLGAFASANGTIVITDVKNKKYRQPYDLKIQLYQYGQRVHFTCA